ncbi:MAG: hypothetical protein VX335_00030 [Pseudomonadota bacterium]|nr:hypothetical protein [Pseudomonadota bacterium]
MLSRFGLDELFENSISSSFKTDCKDGKDGKEGKDDSIFPQLVFDFGLVKLPLKINGS